MRNIFLFIRRYFNFLFFLMMQIVALSFLFRYNQFHEAAFMGVANEVTGRVNKKYNNVEYYFKLKKTNQQLIEENERLHNLLQSNFEKADSAIIIVVDSIRVDSIETYRRYRWHQAKVVGSFMSLQTNYLMIHRGSFQGVKKDMGVASTEGIVGRVVNVGDNYATVMTLLNRQFKADAKLKKGGERGSIEWDGVSPEFVYLKDIPRSAEVAIGDSVVTSELSSIFPPGIMVGLVSEIVEDKSSNFFTVKVKTATNFSTIQFVYVIEDLQREERITLEKEAQKNQ